MTRLSNHPLCNWFYSHIAVSPCCQSLELIRPSSKRIMAFNDRRLSNRRSDFLSFQMLSTFPLARRTPTEHSIMHRRREKRTDSIQGVQRTFSPLVIRSRPFIRHFFTSNSFAASFKNRTVLNITLNILP